MNQLKKFISTLKSNKLYNVFSWKNASISNKMFLSLGVSTVLFTIATIVVIILIQNIKNDIQVEEEKSQQVTILANLGTLINEKDIRIADYITFLRPEDVMNYRILRSNLNNNLSTLKKNNTNKSILKSIAVIEDNNTNIDSLFNDKVIPAVVRLDTAGYTNARSDISSLREKNNVILSKLSKTIQMERNNAIHNADQSMRILIWQIVLIVISATILSGIFVWLLSRSLKNNLSKVIKTAKNVSTGELNVENITYNGKDEIGDLTIAINRMLSSLRQMVMGMKTASIHITENSDQLKNICFTVKNSSEEIAETMSTLSLSAEEQAASTIQLFSHYDSLNNDIEKSTTKGNILKHSTENVLAVTNEGQRQMNESVHQIKTVYDMIQNTFNEVVDMEQKTGEISRLAEVIKSVSSQTHLLALNASIEAARAGESGKGFAVVAQEVKKLAGEVENSLGEINEIVQTVQKMSKEIKESLHAGFEELQSGSTKIQQTGKSFQTIKLEIDNMAVNVVDISNFLESISNSSLEVRSSFEAIAGTTQQFTAGTVQTSSSVQHQDTEIENILTKAQEAAEEAMILAGLVENFKL